MSLNIAFSTYLDAQQQGVARTPATPASLEEALRAANSAHYAYLQALREDGSASEQEQLLQNWHVASRQLQLMMLIEGSRYELN